MILDAGRYLLASAPAETLSEEDTGTEGIEGTCIYDTDEFTFMMPELWRNAGVTAEEEDKILRIMYRGLTLCAFTISENRQDRKRRSAELSGPVLGSWKWIG